MPALAGANLIYGLGMLDLGVTFDYAQLLTDAEIAAMILYTVQGVPVNDVTMSLDNINKVGPFKDFLTHRSTFEYRRSQSQPKLFDRRMRDAWTQAGARNQTDRALEKAREILRTHFPPALPAEVKARLRSIINQAEQEKGLPLSAE